MEFLHEHCVHDAIKSFNVYGYGMCCCASARVEQLARYLGLEARGQSINAHSVPEISWGSQWHMLDASLVNYFRNSNDQIASVAEIRDVVEGWLAQHPDYRGNNEKLVRFQQTGGWTGWKQGPGLLAHCAFYDVGGWWPAHTHGWSSTMQEDDGSHDTPFSYEYGYSQGYEVNVQLRRGERLVRNWFNRGLHVNGVLKDGPPPDCLTAKVGEGAMTFLKGLGDLTENRIGSGQHEYEVPLEDGSFRNGALVAENLACRIEDQRSPALHVKNALQPGLLEIEMPSSYVYLNGKLNLNTSVDSGGKVQFFFSGNNGLDWQEIISFDKSGDQTVDLSKLVFRRYDYRLRILLEGKNTGLEKLAISHEIQCSQRALPALDRGENRISFSAGPQEGTFTIEGSTQDGKHGRQVTPLDFHPVLKDIEAQNFQVKADGASVTFPIVTPGEMTRLRLGGHYRLRDKSDQWTLEVSFDNGKSFRRVDTLNGPFQGLCRYVTINEIPAGTKAALVRWVGKQRNTTCLFLLRIDADYQQPHGGFAPAEITYVWDEGGEEKRDTHIARDSEESYIIHCAAKPKMKSITLELAE